VPGIQSPHAARVSGRKKTAIREFLEHIEKLVPSTVLVQFHAPFSPSHDAVELMVAAMVKAGSAEPAKYLQVLTRTDGFDGVTGLAALDDQGVRRNGSPTLYTFKVQAKASLAMWTENQLADRVPIAPT
jgi:branched-chain amino acid transport system substrate-binding protein